MEATHTTIARRKHQTYAKRISPPLQPLAREHERTVEAREHLFGRNAAKPRKSYLQVGVRIADTS